MKQHTHRATKGKTTIRGWTHCVTPRECAADPRRQAAHGCNVYVAVCSCGALRETESNSSRPNYGPWIDVEVAQ